MLSTADFPPGTDVYARRDVDKLAKMAAARIRGTAASPHLVRLVFPLLLLPVFSLLLLASIRHCATTARYKPFQGSL